MKQFTEEIYDNSVYLQSQLDRALVDVWDAKIAERKAIEALRAARNKAEYIKHAIKMAQIDREKLAFSSLSRSEST